MEYFEPERIESLKKFLDMETLSSNETIPLHFIETHMEWKWSAADIMRRTDVSLGYISRTARELNNAYKTGGNLNLIGKFWNVSFLRKKGVTLDFILDGKFDFWFLNKGMIKKILDEFSSHCSIIEIVVKYHKLNSSFNWEEIGDLAQCYCPKNKFLPFVNYFSYMGINPSCIYKNINDYSLELIELNLSKFNNWRTVSFNENITSSFVLKYENKIWDWITLFNGGKITEKLLERKISPRDEWIRINAKQLSLEFIEKYSKKNLDWRDNISEHPFLTYDFVKKYISKDWSWRSLLKNKIIPLSDITETSEIMKTIYSKRNRANIWKFISQRDDLTSEFIEENKHNLRFDIMSKMEWLTLDLINKHPHLNWDWKFISGKKNMFQRCNSLKEPEVVIEPEVIIERDLKELEVKKPEVKKPEEVIEPEVKKPEEVIEPEVKKPEEVIEPEVKKPEEVIEPEIKKPEEVIEPEIKRCQKEES